MEAHVSDYLYVCTQTYIWVDIYTHDEPGNLKKPYTWKWMSVL